MWDGRPPWRAQQGDMALLAGITARAGQLVDWQHAGFRLSSLSTLSPNQRLNDDIVNARIIQLNKSHSRWLLEGLNVPAVVCVPTWFMTKLMEQQVFDYSAAARFASQEALSAWGSHYGTILDCDLLVAPCFIRPYPEAPLTAVGHWIITVADLNSGEIIHYDPLMVCCLGFFVCVSVVHMWCLCILCPARECGLTCTTATHDSAEVCLHLVCAGCRLSAGRRQRFVSLPPCSTDDMCAGAS